MGNCSGSEISHSEATSSINPSYSTRPSTREATTSCTGQSWFSAGISEAPFSPGEILSSPNLKIYTYADLKNTTRNFSRDLLLGVGGFGNVFKGWVNKKTLAPTKVGTGMIVAIKSWNPHSTQGYEQWQSEVNFLGRISHPNLVKLLGYCWEDKKLLLVYEFMQKGSLSQHLFRSRSSVAEPLSWGARIKIAIGAAKGLHFLHTSERQVIYRDFKTSNVLLDGDYNAKISDFGLAKPGPIGGMSHVTTRVMGTWGYTAPEYMATGRLYVKSDVYSFGVVLLEMMTGLSVFEVHRKTEEQILVDWMKNLLNQTEKLESIMDPGIEGQYSSKAARRFARLTQTCLESEHKERPSMEEVIQVLENIEAINVKLDITKEEKKKMRIRFYLCN